MCAEVVHDDDAFTPERRSSDESNTHPSDSELESSVKSPLTSQRGEEFGERQQTEGNNDQPFARACLGAEWCPIGPVARHGERT